jgi:ABC-2 type transport system ATP-binding protein
MTKTAHDDGSTAGGSTADGSTDSGSTDSGSTAGGSTAGGSTADGSTAEGSTSEGSTDGAAAPGPHSVQVGDPDDERGTATPGSETDPPAGDRAIDGSSDRTFAVTAAGLCKQFGDSDVIKDIDLAIEPGTILGLIGPSGCGKTTTVRLLTGLLGPTDGSAAVFGTTSCELTAQQRARIGYLPQTPALFPELSLDENLSFHASMYGMRLRRRARLDQLLEWVELSEHRSKRVDDASGGMQRRLALAAAFVHDPEIVFLDEPTAGIDPILRDKLWTRFREAAADGRTLIVTTQYVGEAGQCDIVGLLSDGELLLLDSPENLRRAAFEGEVVDITLDRPMRDDELELIAALPFVVAEIERTAPVGLRVVVDDADRAIAELGDAVGASGASIVEMDEHVVDYDEAFLRVVQRHRDSSAAAEGGRDGVIEAPTVGNANGREVA